MRREVALAVGVELVPEWTTEIINETAILF